VSLVLQPHLLFLQLLWTAESAHKNTTFQQPDLHHVVKQCYLVRVRLRLCSTYPWLSSEANVTSNNNKSHFSFLPSRRNVECCTAPKCGFHCAHVVRQLLAWLRCTTTSPTANLHMHAQRLSNQSICFGTLVNTLSTHQYARPHGPP
jgi:hypothetical protein